MLAALVSPMFFKRWGRTCFYFLALIPAASFVWLCTLLPTVVHGDVITEDHSWIPRLGMSLSFRMDALAWILSAMILGIGALILFYCAGYFKHTNQYSGAFAAELVAFAGVMFGLVTADDMMVMFVFWEVTSILSYLLIGYSYGRLSARRAALQALVITTAGGLAMFIGLIMLGHASGSYRFSEVIARAPETLASADSTVSISAALVLVLVGAASKSALFPVHFWLPGAMAAPTPVSAFLHAAAMVKAGIYLIARLSPAFASVPPWTVLIVVLGLGTMLFGGYVALKQHDLKLILAYGTVSQLGFIAMIVGLGTTEALFAGLTMMVAHALFKSVLFLVTGIIDHQAGTRVITKLSGIHRKSPTLFVMALLSAASMAGLPPLLGFVGKEAIIEVLVGGLDAGVGALGAAGTWIVLIGISVGSVLTFAYSARFVWGAFATKPAGYLEARPESEVVVEPTDFHPVTANFAAAPAIITVLTVVLGLWPAPLDHLVAACVEPFGGTSKHLALWHGLTPALGISVLIIVCGILLYLGRFAIERVQMALPSFPPADAVYRAVIGGIDYAAVRVTGATQRGSLSFYLAVIMTTAVVVPTVGLFIVETPPLNAMRWTDSPAQWATVVIMIAAALVALRASKRFLAIIMVSVTGYGISLLFALRGAPDLALTQMLVETISLIAFVLALRMLPSRLWNVRRPRHQPIRVIIAVGFGLFMMALAAFSLSSRVDLPISLDMPKAAYELGHGKNVVNVTLVDIRAWDTFGEISVLALAATGVASLIFIQGRQDLTRNKKHLTPQNITDVSKRYSRRTDLSPGAQVANDFMNVRRDPFIVAGRTLAPENRSLMLEVVTRVMFHSLMMVSIYLLLAGHNLPGGGFAGGLLAGLAMALRYLAGGRYELGVASPVNAGVLLGSGLLVAGVYAVTPLLWGGDIFSSYALDLHLPVFGEVHFVTSVVFDIGVYLVVIGLILDVLRSLGGKVDESLEKERDEAAARKGKRKRRRIQVRRAGNAANTPMPSGPVTATPVEDTDGDEDLDTQERNPARTEGARS